MTVFQWLYQLIFGPLELLFEFVYSVSYNIVGDPGIAIIPLSLCMNFLALPFYNRADAIQQEERKREKEMSPDVEHIKKVFKADERYMMLQAYYRIKGYRPIYALRSSLPLLLEIPFFVAAYVFLSNLLLLYGARFGILTNLGMPDQLLSFGGFKINLLPIVMTLINIFSSSVYSKELSKKDKIYLYGSAIIFFLLLYNSPSGLVLYWTLNQIFSLVKNLVASAKNRKLMGCSILSGLGILIITYSCLTNRIHTLNRLLIAIVGLTFQIPAISGIIQWKRKNFKQHRQSKKSVSSLHFFLGCLFLTILTGLLIPSTVIKSSPIEFVVISDYQSPFIYIFDAFLLAAGTFLIWLSLFYYLANNKVKRILNIVIWTLSVVAFVNYMFFGTHLGNLTTGLQYEQKFSFSMNDMFVNIGLLILIIGICLGIWRKFRKIVQHLLSISIITVFGMFVCNMTVIASELTEIKMLVKQEQNSTKEKASFTLSRKGKNVIVFMLDRGISSYVPYLIQENPDILRQFAGFTWYPNTLSYGANTNTASPALFGGYEYTPEELNKRSSEALVVKQNEALKIMPVLFDKAGYNVTVCDPPYAGYTWIPDLSIFDEYKNIRRFNTGNGQFSESNGNLRIKQRIWKRNFYCYSIMKISPLFLQSWLYKDGSYHNLPKIDSLDHLMQLQANMSISFGVPDLFMNPYSALRSLSDMIRISEGDENTFLMIANDTVHNAIMLQEPQYEPSLSINNQEYDTTHQWRFSFNGKTMRMNTPFQMAHYQSMMASFINLGKWFNYMRQEGVYDNTRIIIVADHGRALEQFDDMIFGNKNYKEKTQNPEDAMAYNPLLMVKDFDSHDFTTDNQFMTNADTPLLAMDRLIKNPVNPFTGNRIKDGQKYADEQHVFYTDLWNVEYNHGNTFLPGSWYALKNRNIFNMNNWSKLGDY